MRIDLIAGAATVLFVNAASAQTLYRCTGADGKVAYQDKPCSAGAQQSAPKIDPVPVDEQARRAAEARVARDKAQVQRLEALEAAEQAKRQAAEQRVLADYERKRQANETGRQYGIAVGQSASDVRKTFGDPEKINFSADGSEQWVYRNERSEIRYVYIRNGSVTSWQGTRTRP